eukprot:3056331-Rhodomonas_salina.1
MHEACTSGARTHRAREVRGWRLDLAGDARACRSPTAANVSTVTASTGPPQQRKEVWSTQRARESGGRVDEDGRIAREGCGRGLETERREERKREERRRKREER